MTVTTIAKGNFGMQIKGDCETHNNVIEIRQKDSKTIELIKGPNWQILVNPEYYHIIIV